MLSLILLYKKRRNNWLNRRKRILATLSLILERRRREVLSILTAITTQIGQITTFRIHNNRFRSCQKAFAKYWLVGCRMELLRR